LILGPMFSGKTTELMRRVRRLQIGNQSCVIIKYANDNRYDKDGVATHDLQIAKAISSNDLFSIESQAESYGVIGIDEGQFFPDVVPFAEHMANKGKLVIVAALDGTFQRKGFGDFLNLIPLAEDVMKLSAVCMLCYSEGAFTKRLSSEQTVEVIGGTDKYMAVCRNCYKKPIKELHLQETPTKATNLGRKLILDEEVTASS
ncbi:uncharacterized protein TRIADDRAFT_31584, partial [Trichoplax adhaerens]